MKKSTIIIIVVLIVGVLAVVSYGLGQKKSGDDTVLSEETTTKETGQEQTEKAVHTSIKDLMSENKPVKCVATVDMNDGEKMTGTVYIADGKMRNDAEIENKEGEKTQLHTIIDEDWFYSWSTGLPNGGIKMKVSDIENIPDQEGGDPSGEVKNLDKDFNFDCSKWTVDNSKFVPPSDVTFQDFTQKMKDMQEMTSEFEVEDEPQEMTLEQVCQMCGMLPDEEAKQQCRTDAGCE